MEVIKSQPRQLGKGLDFNARSTGKIPGSVKERSLSEPSVRKKEDLPQQMGYVPVICVTAAHYLTETT